MNTLINAITDFLGNPEVVKFLKQIMLISFVVGALTLLSGQLVFPLLKPLLTGFFSIVRQFIMPFDFMIDTGMLLQLLTYSFAVQVGIWVIRAYISAVHFFNDK